MLSKGLLYVELYHDLDVSVVQFPKSLAELRMRMELAGFDLGELGDAEPKTGGIIKQFPLDRSPGKWYNTGIWNLNFQRKTEGGLKWDMRRRSIAG